MKLNETEGKKVRIKHLDGKEISGTCFLYIPAKDNDEDCNAIAIKNKNGNFWIDENEIQSIEIMEEAQ